MTFSEAVQRMERGEVVRCDGRDYQMLYRGLSVKCNGKWVASNLSLRSAVTAEWETVEPEPLTVDDLDWNNIEGDFVRWDANNCCHSYRTRPEVLGKIWQSRSVYGSALPQYNKQCPGEWDKVEFDRPSSARKPTPHSRVLESCCEMGSYDHTVPQDARGWRIETDLCIADIVAALNAANIPTEASCCGHGEMLGSILLEDGRHILVCPDLETGVEVNKEYWIKEKEL